MARPNARGVASARPQAIGPDEALARVKQAIGDRASRVELNFGQVDLTCEPGELLPLVTALAETPGLECKFLTFLSGIDWSEFGDKGSGDSSPGGAEGNGPTSPGGAKGNGPTSPGGAEGNGPTSPGGAEEGKSGLEVLVHVYSPDYVVHVNVHVPVDPAHPVCPSITSVYAGAIWHERETHEMFGVVFEDHPRLVNLYLPEDFEGHPLLKSFHLATRAVKDWPGAKDPEEAAAGGR